MRAGRLSLTSATLAPMAGQIHRIKSLLHSLTLYIEARGKLFQIEAQDAAAKILVISVVTAILVACLLTCWILAVPALVWIVAQAIGWTWASVALLAALMHLVLAYGCLLGLRARFKQLRAFEETFRQFKYDRDWISKSTNTSD